MGPPGLFLFIFVHFKQSFTEKSVGISGIRTRIVGVEGKHANPLTTTTDQSFIFIGLRILIKGHLMAFADNCFCHTQNFLFYLPSRDRTISLVIRLRGANLFIPSTMVTSASTISISNPKQNIHAFLILCS